MADLSQLSDDDLRKLHALKSMSDEELIGEHQKARGRLAGRGPLTGGTGTLEQGARALGHGATFGYLDEGLALAREQLGQGEYEDLVRAEREKYEEIPGSAKVMGDLVGGTATALAAPLAIPGKVAQGGAYLAAKLPGWLKAAGLSGAYGALYGSGTAEEGERLEGAKKGGATGAALGLAGYPVVKGAQWVGGKVGEGVRTRTQNPVKAAKKTLANRVALDELNKAKMEQRLTDLGEGATIFDVGRSNVQGLGRHVASVPGPARNRAGALLDSRARAESSRVNEAINKGLSPTEYYAAKDAFLDSMKTRASPLYEKAYKAHQSIVSKPLDRLLRDPDTKAAMKEAVVIARRERAIGGESYLGEISDELTEALSYASKRGFMETGAKRVKGVGPPGVAKGLSLRTYNHIKMGFDELLDQKKFTNQTTGRLTRAGKSVFKMKKKLLEELDAATGGASGDYAKARKIWAGEAESLDALDEGRKAINMDPDLIVRRIAKLSDAGKEAYRTGFARALKKTVGSTRGKGSPANRIFDSNWQRRRIRAVFPNNDDYRTFRKALVAQQRFAQGRAGATTGSMTEPRRAEGVDILEEAGGVAGVFAGTAAAKQTGGNQLMLAGMGRRALRKTADALLGPVKAHDLEAAKLIFNRDPAANRAAIDAIFEKRIWDSLPEATKKTIGQALMVGAGQQGATAGSAAQEYLE